jgi:hypothetical protein
MDCRSQLKKKYITTNSQKGEVILKGCDDGKLQLKLLVY